MGLLYGRAGRLTAKNGGFRPGQSWDQRTGGFRAGETLDLYTAVRRGPQADGVPEVHDRGPPSAPRRSA